MEILDKVETIVILNHRLKELSKAIGKNDLVEIDTTWFYCKVAWQNLYPRIDGFIKMHEQNKESK